MPQSQSPIALALAEGNPLVLSALADHFSRDRRFSLVATSATAEGFLATVMRVPTAIGILDWEVPVIGGEKLIQILRAQDRAPRLIVWGDDARDAPRRAMLAGAAAFVPKSAPPERLTDAALAVQAGQMVFPFLDLRSIQADPIQSLTRRERDLLDALSHGQSNKEIARDAGISANTVKFHLSNLYEKLGVASRAQAIAFYFQNR